MLFFQYIDYNEDILIRKVKILIGNCNCFRLYRMHLLCNLLWLVGFLDLQLSLA